MQILLLQHYPSCVSGYPVAWERSVVFAPLGSP